ncbi:hypothetical protein AG1IA_00569 [Rhizoctonia solani AG-1 IA]|uniref:Aminotransferase class I/classII domain-containing protein n=1 Tax=Thanatephorus cucumeris (strain AG1-IA) TaxID=983506 RepID=L8X8L4_THACA|nr:hypothetical protein AG1IA_00569 [Rhizoctonia solani AG-1 IA]
MLGCRAQEPNFRPIPVWYAVDTFNRRSITNDWSGSFLDGGANHPLQLAAVPLLDPEYVKQSKLALQKHFRAKRDHVLKRLEKIGLPVAITPESTFYIWLDLRALPAPLNDGLVSVDRPSHDPPIPFLGLQDDRRSSPPQRSLLLSMPPLLIDESSRGFNLGVGLDAIERVFRRAKREGLDNIGSFVIGGSCQEPDRRPFPRDSFDLIARSCAVRFGDSMRDSISVLRGV